MNILKFEEFNEPKYDGDEEITLDNLSDSELDSLINDALDEEDVDLLNKVMREYSKRHSSNDKSMSRSDMLNHEISKKFDLTTILR